jgi:hypothetical protein
MTSVPAAPSSHRPTDALTRWVAGFIVVILLDASQLLAFYPDRTATLWAWTIQPELSAMVLGSVYTGGAYFFARVLFGASWQEVAAGFPAIALFVWMATLATALHLDRFAEDSLPFAAWAALYVVTPLLVPYLYLRNRRRAGVAGGAPLPRGIRTGLAVVGGLIVALALLVFAAPDAAIGDWPWTLTPLTARITAAVVALYGAVWLAVAAHGTWTAARIPLQSHVIGLAVFLVSVARDESVVDWGPLALVVVAVAAAMLAVSAVLAWKAA